MRTIILTVLLVFVIFPMHARYSKYFKNSALRVEFTLTSSHQSEELFIEGLVKEKEWGGRKQNLNKSLDYGTYKVELYDFESKALIYTDGFCTLSEEYAATEPAKTEAKSFANAVLIPFPKHQTKMLIVKRNGELFTDTLHQSVIDPKSKNIEKAVKQPYKCKYLTLNNKPDKAIDILILAEGYTKEDEDLFFADAKLLNDMLFTSAVFKRNKAYFNVAAVASISEQSGVDNPGDSIQRNSIFNGSYYTLNSERYLMMQDYQKVRAVASILPYDQIYILVNSSKYGGGGILNYASVATAHSRNAKEVVIHEFGHAFGALGDEYYTSEVSFDTLIEMESEPWQPNLTVDTVNIKWQHLISDGTPIPTPNSSAFGHETVGLFEGGGYQTKGIYRPAYDCRMKTNKAADFCPVCEEAIEQAIKHYTGR